MSKGQLRARWDMARGRTTTEHDSQTRLHASLWHCARRMRSLSQELAAARAIDGRGECGSRAARHEKIRVCCCVLNPHVGSELKKSLIFRREEKEKRGVVAYLEVMGESGSGVSWRSVGGSGRARTQEEEGWMA